MASSSLASWGGDVCHTTLTVRASYFRMVSFRVDKSLYAVSPQPFPNVTEGNQSLCQFPDAPGMMEGRITRLERCPEFVTLPQQSLCKTCIRRRRGSESGDDNTRESTPAGSSIAPLR
jgi:hypothetical protein